MIGRRFGSALVRPTFQKPIPYINDVHLDDTINVIGTFTKILDEIPEPSGLSPSATITISSAKNTLVLHPDLLLPITSISNSFVCPRKPLLTMLPPANQPTRDKSEEPLLWGTLLHEVVQDCLASGAWSKGAISAAIIRVLRDPASLSQLFRVDRSLKEAEHELRLRAGGLEGFARKFIRGAVPVEEKAEKEDVEITGLHKIEEEIWSTAWGLRGIIDAVVEAVVEDDPPPKKTNGLPRSASAGSAGMAQESKPTGTSWTIPFEIKTGRTVGGIEHRAQTMLYTILVSERYGVQTPTGILYYTQKDEIIQVHPARNELRGLIIGRNELAASIMHHRELPSTETPTIKCESTDAQNNNFLPPPIDEEYQCSKCYVKDTCALYRTTVERLPPSPIKELADKTTHLTPAQSEFFARWETLIALEEQDMVRFRKELWTMGAKERETHGRCFARMIAGPWEKRDRKFFYQFTRAPPPESFGSVDSLLSSHIVKGDAVTLSIDPGLLAFSRGYVSEITATCLTVVFDQEVPLEGVAVRKHSKSSTEPVVLRIDKDDYSGGMARLRSNLAALFYKPGDERRLALVVDLIPPRFLNPASEDEKIPASRTNLLNSDQKAAMEFILRAQDYALILGMPGTGKTTMVAELIKELVRRGKSVLLTSYTHSAVDTILLKLLDVDFDILRLGYVDKIHLETRKFSLAAKAPPESLEELERRLLRPPVVATTSLSIEHRDARKGGMDVSLFRRLSDAHPKAVVDLALQYRMNSEIMTLSNKLIYSDRLRCGNDQVATQVLPVPNKSMGMAWHNTCGNTPKAQCWLDSLVDPRQVGIRFVDTDSLPARNTVVGPLIQNDIEAQLVVQTVEALLRGGVEPAQIGVISVYRQQTRLLSHLLQHSPGVEVLTADRSQGRDKDCILISMVRSNEDGNIGDLLKDWRRLNVSFTRARSKLVIFGSRSTLRCDALLEQFFDLVDEHSWYTRLPPGAHLMHDFSKGPSKRTFSEPTDAQSLPGAGARDLTVKRARVAEGILKGRALLRDISTCDE
ncbi:P-loop containing nucleoside triphosphate hydrolase protein [Ceratobasidium sp. AG-I]|nr:P-loop containing nucleoside triphosphate hydrolase protein [Ceratobasidium sp. AG-I]